MEHYTYRPLEGDRAIRLLELKPGPHIAAPIECQLLDASIEDGTSYEALSYTWGDASLVRSVKLYGNVFPITVNLDLALRHLRHHDKPRVLWIDAICINQADLMEQAEQVRMMWKIYQNATRVVVWLGPTVRDTAIAMDRIASRESQTKEKARKTWKPHDGQGSALRCGCHAGKFDSYPSRIGIWDLLSSPWFTRVWILQEVAAAKDILVVCGNKTASGQDFFDELESLSTNSMTRTMATIIRRFRHPVDLMNKEHRRSGGLTAGSVPLIELIERFRTSEATKLPDKLFALLAFSSDASQAPELQPDYTVSEDALAQRIVRFAFPTCSIDHTKAGDTDGVTFEVEGLILGRVGGQWYNGVRHYPVDSSDTKVPMTVWNQHARKLFGEDQSWEILIEDERTLNEDSMVVLLRGASRPSVIRLHERETIVEMLATPEPTRGTSKFSTINSEARIFAWPETFKSLSEETEGWMKFKLTWNPFGPPEPTNIERYIPTPNSFAVQMDAHLEALKDEADSGSQSEHDCNTITSLWVAIGSDEEAIKAGTSRLTVSLHQAAYTGYFRTTKLLLDANADVNAMHDQLGTPLHVAAARGHESVAKALIDAGADVHAVNGAGQTPLVVAAMNGAEAISQLLMSAGAVPPIFDWMPVEQKMLAYAMLGNAQMVEGLLREGLDANFAHVGLGATGLHCAAEMGRPETAKVFLRAGADVNTRTRNGKTPLHLAAMNGHAEVALVLLGAGAEVNGQDGNGATPLDTGLGNGKLDVSRVLVEAGGLTCTFRTQLSGSGP